MCLLEGIALILEYFLSGGVLCEYCAEIVLEVYCVRSCVYCCIRGCMCRSCIVVVVGYDLILYVLYFAASRGALGRRRGMWGRFGWL